MYQSMKWYTSGVRQSGPGFLVPAAPAGTPYVLTQTPGTASNSFTRAAGIRIVPTATNTITQLGRWVISGNSQTHTLYLMYYDGAWHDLGNCSVNTSGATPGEYLYCTLGTPQVINTSMTYVALLSSETSGGDQFYLEDTTVDSVTAGIATVNAAVSDTGIPPTNPQVASLGSVTYGPVNFKVQ